jgi:hypothetical protein
MRLSLIPISLALLALGACDSVTKLAQRQAPAAAPACRPVDTAPACPGMAAEAPKAATAVAEIAPYPAGPYVAVERPVARRVFHRVVAHRQRAQALTEVRQYAYAREETLAGGPRPAPPYDGQVEVPERRAYARIESESRYSETAHYSEESRAYASSGSAYGGGYVQAARTDCACGPVPAAGRDRNGFLTWPGKPAARP